MIKPNDIEICVSTKDDGKDGDGKYCATVKRWNEHSGFWYNIGIAVREKTPIQAFIKAIDSATKEGWWK